MISSKMIAIADAVSEITSRTGRVRPSPSRFLAPSPRLGSIDWDAQKQSDTALHPWNTLHSGQVGTATHAASKAAL